MIYEFQVGTSVGGSSLIEEFQNRLRWIKQRGFTLDIEIRENQESGIDLIRFCLEGKNQDRVFRDEDIRHIFRHQLAESLAEHIVVSWEEKLLWKEVARSHRKSSPTEKEAILEKARDILHNSKNSESLNLLLSFGRKTRIIQRLLEHIKDHGHLDLEGFITFCLQDFLTELKYAVELAFEEKKNEKEYSDFVSLLRYFVDSQFSKMEEVNLMVKSDGLFYLWDGSGVPIEEKYINYYMDEMLTNEVSLDDVLVSILITIAPLHIILHNTGAAGSSEPVMMIRNVFGDRISECPGCERCHPQIREQHKGS
ncbi:MAG TPA: putative sporulation protein YtxC [Syntrophomonadaceae bacterium]|nr:putative sporulation protein YtxC [Syntrophomonadaceae bacterium]